MVCKKWNRAIKVPILRHIIEKSTKESTSEVGMERLLLKKRMLLKQGANEKR